MTQQTEDRLSLAYSKLGLREPFIAAVMTRIKREVSEKIPTAATNGSWVKFNPLFVEKLNDEELFGLVLHESCHVVLLHSWRREGRDPTLWNIANDAVINAYVLGRGYTLPTGGVVLSWVKEAHSAEQVYDQLKKDQQNNQQGKGGKPQPKGGGFDGTGDCLDAADEAALSDLEATIAASAQMAKTCGHGSSMIDRVLGNVGKPNVRWQDVTRSMLTSSSTADYTYMRPSRRFIGSGLYMPSLRVEAVGGLAVGFDTSGSIGQRECDQIARELQSIVDDLCPAFVEVIYCDSKVKSVQRFEPEDLLELKPKGGGGTAFKPVFDYIVESDDTYAGMIYFTDLEGDLDECDDPGIPVLWADIGRSHPATPFGTRIDVPL